MSTNVINLMSAKSTLCHIRRVITVPAGGFLAPAGSPQDRSYGVFSTLPLLDDLVGSDALRDNPMASSVVFILDPLGGRLSRIVSKLPFYIGLRYPLGDIRDYKGLSYGVSWRFCRSAYSSSGSASDRLLAQKPFRIKWLRLFYESGKERVAKADRGDILRLVTREGRERQNGNQKRRGSKRQTPPGRIRNLGCRYANGSNLFPKLAFHRVFQNPWKGLDSTFTVWGGARSVRA